MDARAELTMSTTVEVELTVGPKMAAWLQSLGWTPPLPEQPADDEENNA